MNELAQAIQRAAARLAQTPEERLAALDRIGARSRTEAIEGALSASYLAGYYDQAARTAQTAHGARMRRDAADHYRRAARRYAAALEGL